MSCKDKIELRFLMCSDCIQTLCMERTIFSVLCCFLLVKILPNSKNKYIVVKIKTTNYTLTKIKLKMSEGSEHLNCSQPTLMSIISLSI